MKAFDVRESKIRGIMGEVQETLDRVDGSFANLQKTTADAQQLLMGAEKTGLVFQNLVQSVDQLTTKFVSKESTRPFDIKDYSEILTKLQDTLQQMNELVNNVNQTGSPIVTNMVDQFNNAADRRVDHIFWRLAQLIFIISLLVMIVLVVHNLFKRREVHPSNQ